MLAHMLSTDRGSRALEYGLTAGLVALAAVLAILSLLVA